MAKELVMDDDFFKPDVLEIQTEKLGEILVSHWSVKALGEIHEILLKGVDVPEKFVIEFVRALGRVPSMEVDISKRFESGGRIDVGLLTSNDLEKIATEYLEKWKYDVLYWTAYDESNEIDYNLEKNEGEDILDYFYRIVKLSVEKSNEQMERSLKQFKFSGIGKSVFKSFSKNQRKIGSLSAKIKGFGVIPQSYRLPKVHELPERGPLKIENPGYETNTILDIQSQQLDKLTSLLEVQGERAVLLNQQTELLLGENVKSSTQSKFAIWVAALGILISAIFSGYSIYRTSIDDANNKRLVTEIHNLITNQKQVMEYEIEMLTELRTGSKNLDSAAKSINAELQGLSNSAILIENHINKGNGDD